MCRFEHVLCADFSTSYVYTHAGFSLRSFGSLRSLYIYIMPNHATCLHDRARRLLDMSPIEHQASLGNSMVDASTLPMRAVAAKSPHRDPEMFPRGAMGTPQEPKGMPRGWQQACPTELYVSPYGSLWSLVWHPLQSITINHSQLQSITVIHNKLQSIAINSVNYSQLR